MVAVLFVDRAAGPAELRRAGRVTGARLVAVADNALSGALAVLAKTRTTAVYALRTVA